ncbi:hypothetical protein UP10_41770 [Bradyrhizobium sp. LTSPM299]|uniref:tetratricopeptide repeat protein n=1 Tax=Bradyrhizobium sp. LTSPM299 TaxID=1619233 RepID=UPI0005C7E881|nr:tetratricopeptide repeat protein [Bradyrhizobium sp. LTSPM299]KJC53631.1 hypothetical protein UP10_41770 [Bradyrhizobium sp. LTSPM299]
MFKSFGGHCPTIQKVFVILSVLQLTGCGSPEDRAKQYYEHGLKLLSEHDNAKAALEFRNAVRLKGDLIGAWKALAEIDESNRNWQGVVTDLRNMVTLAPNDASAKLKLSKLLLRAGSTDEALRLAKAGIEMDNRSANFHALKAAISLKLNDHSDAVREANIALEVNPGNADALMVLAVDQLGRGDAKGALQLLQGALSVQAKDLESILGFQLLKIRLLRQTGDLTGAEATLKKVIELNPMEIGYRKLLIDLYVEERRTDHAEKELRSLAAVNSSDPDPVLDLARFLYRIKKDPAAARQELNTRISTAEDSFPFQIALADMDVAEGKLTDGEQLLEKLIRTANLPEHVRTAKTALAQIYLGKKDFDSAEKLATDVLSGDAHNVSALRLRASIHLERAQLDLAITDLLDALNYQPRSVDLMSLLGTAYERSGLIELADKQLADAARLSDVEPKVSLDYAGFLRRRGNIARAEEVLVGLDKRRPNDIKVLSALGQVRLERQNWSGAQQIAASIRQVGNYGGIADELLGAALIGSKKYDEAIAAFKSAYNAGPNRAHAMNSLIGAFLEAHKTDEAISFLKSVLENDPSNGNALALRGSIQLSNGAPDLALKDFSAAIKAQPNDTVGYRALADFYMNQKNYAEAVKVAQTGIRRQPNAVALHMILANAYEQQGNYEAADAEYESILRIEPGNLIAANNLASLLLDHRDDEASLKKAQALAAILRKSEVPQFKDTLGWASYHHGDYQTAVSLSKAAVAALPDQAAVHYHLGMSYIAIGEPTKASEQLKEALELAPNNQLTEIIRNGLKKAGS